MSKLSEHVAVYRALGYDGFLRKHPHAMLLHIKQTFDDNQNVVRTANFPEMLSRAVPADVDVFPVLKHTPGPASDGITVGRADTCDICLPYKDISKQHAIVARVGNSYTVKDLGSRNGTAINGKTLTANTPGRLEDGSDVAFARIHTCFMLPEGFAMLVKWAKIPG